MLLLFPTDVLSFDGKNILTSRRKNRKKVDASGLNAEIGRRPFHWCIGINGEEVSVGLDCQLRCVLNHKQLLKMVGPSTNRWRSCQ